MECLGNDIRSFCFCRSSRWILVAASLDSLKAELLRKEDPEDSTPEKIEDPQGFRIP